MCGICGRINRENGDAAALQRKIEHMMKLMEHRGPDHGGHRVDSAGGIGYRRLSVIDLDTGNQPVISEDGNKVLVFNGEIYNFLELKKQFAGELIFHTNSDTEVLMRLYEKFGVQCLQHLRGMYAFAIWDQHQKELFFARDRTGKKPLFYSVQKNNFIFASELRCLLVHEDFDFEIDPESIHHYLSLQYIPSPRTIFKNVFKLPPAHFGIVKNGEVSIERYWNLDYISQQWKEEEALERFDQLLRESVSLRLISDVPLGAFLSGGIDSSAVVSMMSALAGDRVKTFSISFSEEEFNEGPFAKIVAEKFNTDHHELKVVPDHAAIIPKLVWHYSEPFADASAIPFYYLSAMSREFVTVALTGDGGDELFGGYPRYRFKEPYGKKTFAGSVPLQFLQKIPASMKGFWKIRRWSEEKLLDLPSIYFEKISFFDEAEKKNLFSPAFQETTRNISTLEWLSQKLTAFAGASFPQNLMSFDTATYLPDDLLVKADVASMACSLEVRSPFLDQEMMEFAASLPVSLKIRDGVSKWLLRTYLRGKIPDPLIERSKMGFGVPLHKWFRNELREMTEDVLLSRSAQRGYFRRSVVEKIIRKHCSGLFDHSYQLYTLLVLELWHKAFVDNRKESLLRSNE